MAWRVVSPSGSRHPDRWPPGTQPGCVTAFRGRAWIGVELLAGCDDAARLAALLNLSSAAGLPAVAAGDVHMHVRGRRALQDTLSAIRIRTTLAEAGEHLYPNGERHLRSREDLARIYPPELLRATLDIADRVCFSLDELRYEYPQELVPAGYTPGHYLRLLTEQGMCRRWPAGAPAQVRVLVEHELRLIGELRYESFFLTVHDIVQHARGLGILCQGRGSAANSAVCFCLGITEVDPARMSLLVERFISRERNEPPDIDVDFEHERREEVIQYIYGRYGRERAALTAAVITYCPRSAVRDVGRALGLAGLQVEQLARAMQWWDGRRIEDERIIEAGLDPASPDGAPPGAACPGSDRLSPPPFPARRRFRDFPGAAVAVSCQSRTRRWTAARSSSGTRTTSTISDCSRWMCWAWGCCRPSAAALALINGYYGRDLTLASVPAEDPAVYDMIGRADTMGVFQIESRAQMAMLPRLKPRCYYDLVIEVALIRPGPIQGDMVHPYLRRRNGRGAGQSIPAPRCAQVLARTLGVPIFQEQVMQLAVVAAGFTPGEADQLRRAMAAWKRRGGLEPFERRLMEGMRRRGYTHGIRAADLPADSGFRRIRFSRIPCGELCPAGVRLGLAEMP